MATHHPNNRAIGYSDQQINQMKRDAERRMREMQQRAMRAANRSSPAPETPPAPHEPAPAAAPSAPTPDVSSALLPALIAEPLAGGNLLDLPLLKALGLDRDRLLIIAVGLILLSESTDPLLLMALVYIFL